MKIIITCDPENMAAAQALANEEIGDEKWPWQTKYNKPGWGWFFIKNDARFFVRGIIGGLSITQESYLAKSTRSPR